MIDVLILGASGLVGSTFHRLVSPTKKVVGTYFSRPKQGLSFLDITDADSLRRALASWRPRVVIHAACNTHVDGCERDQEEAHRVNVVGTENIARACQAGGAKLVFFSTDYIFDGRAGPYSEEDEPQPINYYGLTKLEGERAITSKLESFLVLRTHGVFGWEEPASNFVLRLIGNSGEGKVARVPSDQFGTPTAAVNLADMAWRLIVGDKSGIYNLAGSDFLDRYSFSLMIAEVFGLDKSLIVAEKTRALGQAAPRPLRAGLRVDKIRTELGDTVWSARQGLERLKAELKARHWQP